MPHSIQHAIILAGGFGTRLKGVVQDVPKPMAPINERPFLEYQLDYLISQKIKSVTLCTGYLSEQIEKHFSNRYRTLEINYSVEDTPLGTGGAIKKALEKIDTDFVAVLNGDSFFGVDIPKMSIDLNSNSVLIKIALKHLRNFDRYGAVQFNDQHHIVTFKEKETVQSGWINGGVYLIHKNILEHLPQEATFSFENFLANYTKEHTIDSFLSSAYFIDIGIPEDFQTAQVELPLATKNTWKGWTLFLDRDGVINTRTPGDYVKSIKEWEYCEKALLAIKNASLLFDRIIVVTNQQGVALKKMSAYHLSLIHQKLKDDVLAAGGHLDAIYASTDLKEKENNSRKPNSTMATWAQTAFPEIDFTRSIMIGDSASDVEFGQQLGMKTISIRGKEEDYTLLKALKPNWDCSNLLEAVHKLSLNTPSAI